MESAMVHGSGHTARSTKKKQQIFADLGRFSTSAHNKCAPLCSATFEYGRCKEGGMLLKSPKSSVDYLPARHCT